jgi:S1-C subfamily serine protease
VSSDDTREYVLADIIGIDCERDLLLIAVEQSEIKRLSGEQCAQMHPNIQISRNLASAGEDSMLLSWPFEKHRRVATGCVGERRNVREVSRPNKNEYNMEVLEANITSESGSSGAPLLNKSGEAIGLLHGGFGMTHSYFIPSDLIWEFLAPYVMTSGNVYFCLFFHTDTQYSQAFILILSNRA